MFLYGDRILISNVKTFTMEHNAAQRILKLNPSYHKGGLALRTSERRKMHPQAN